MIIIFTVLAIMFITMLGFAGAALVSVGIKAVKHKDERIFGYFSIIFGTLLVVMSVYLVALLVFS